MIHDHAYRTLDQIDCITIKIFIMKKSQKGLLWMIPAVIVFAIACNNEKTAGVATTTDIPLNSKSKEAIASFQEGLAYSDVNDAQQAKASFSKAI